MPNDADRQAAAYFLCPSARGWFAAHRSQHPDDNQTMTDLADAFERHRLASEAAAYQAGQRDMQSATGPMWETLATIAATSDCEASRKAAAEAMAEVEPVLDAILALPVKETPDGTD